MKKIHQYCLAWKIERFWKKAEGIKKRMYANPTPEQFRRLADAYRLNVLQARQNQLLYDISAGIRTSSGELV